MKVVILAGGYGYRLGEETISKPKPMVEVGGKPILWHIMKIYSSYGFNEFIVLLGYQSYIIKEYFFNYALHQNDVLIDFATNNMEVFNNKAENWKVMLLDTGVSSMTGSRIKKAQSYIGDEPFLLTYGDGVADINISELIKFHKAHGKTMTLTAVVPKGRFGVVEIGENNMVDNFLEKPEGDGSWINGGFFVCNNNLFDYIPAEGDKVIFEQEPLQKLAKRRELLSYQHNGFWKCMDTLRDKKELCDMWDKGTARWKVWD